MNIQVKRSIVSNVYLRTLIKIKFVSYMFRLTYKR